MQPVVGKATFQSRKMQSPLLELGPIIAISGTVVFNDMTVTNVMLGHAQWSTVCPMLSCASEMDKQRGELGHRIYTNYRIICH